ncbi:hypothetical protein TrVFT333_002843 [Trichoderma virens FT-333]|nr:hypothetical protein TrVFT333_002843 [Trichoderma virens FT-333]
MATQQSICANWSADSTGCKKFGNYTCKGCYLVVYCGSDCQKSHWASHKIDCKSSLGNETWRPQWNLENRNPPFLFEMRNLVPSFHGNKSLWGNIPAIDVLQLGSNEGDDYEKQLNLLFAASGDLRNVVKTIAQMPGSYNKPMDVVINDSHFDVVARNAIILLIALVADNIDEAADCMIHVWYSALIRKSDLDMLQQKVLPLVESICEKIKDKNSSSLLGKTWRFGQRSLRLVLPKASWDRLLAFLNIPKGLTAEQASRVRMAITLDESKKDNLDLHLIFQTPSRRIAKHRFRQDGLLLPFGASRHEFQEPNPTLFQVSNMADNLHAGMHTTAYRMGPLLQAPHVNPHATLITLFREAIRETMTMQDRIMDMYTYRPETKLIRKYFAYIGAYAAGYNPDAAPLSDPKAIKWTYAQANVANYDPIFDRFMNNFRFSQVEQLFGVTMKRKNTVIEKWPFKMKLQYGQPGALEELIQLTDEVVLAKERYVEWRRF